MAGDVTVSSIPRYHGDKSVSMSRCVGLNGRISGKKSVVLL